MGVPKTTAKIKVPKRLIDQVVGQDNAVEIVRTAAAQRRHVLLIGEPGTGKSMIAQGMAELLPKNELQDVLIFPNEEDDNTPKVRTLPAGVGKRLVERARTELKSAESFRKTMFMALMFGIIFITAYYFVVQQQPLVLFGGITAAVFLLIGMHYTRPPKNAFRVPKLLLTHKVNENPPFVDATGLHAGALLGDVRHDPFQSGGLETSAHDRVEPGAIHRAHKGVLFVDEIATLSPRSQIEMLTAMQEGKCSITGRSERSSGSMVKTEPVPCEFVLVAAGNLPTLNKIHPALRSRIRGYGYEVYMNETMPDTPENTEKIVQFIAQEVVKDGKIPHFAESGIEKIILEARRKSGRKGHLTLKLRELGGLVRAAGDVAKTAGAPMVTAEHVETAAKKSARTMEQQVADVFVERKKEYQVILNEGAIVGRVNGLAVVGSSDTGLVLPIEAEVTPGGDKSEIVATGSLGKIAKEAIQNVAAVVKKLYGEDLRKSRDIYVQFLQTYEGVEGDSASVAVATAIISAYKKVAVDQSVAMTGSLSVRGDVLPVGGITAKIEAAISAGMRKVIIPEANAKDVMLSKEMTKKIKIVTAKRIEDVLKEAVVGKKSILDAIVPKLAVVGRKATG